MSDSTSLPPPQTPAQEPQAPGLPELVLASRWQRRFAAMIDLVVFPVALTFLSFHMDELRSLGLARKVLVDVLFGGAFGIPVLQGCLLLTRGQSLGDMILKMRILSLDGSRVPGKAELRAFGLFGFYIMPLSIKHLSEQLGVGVQFVLICSSVVVLWFFILYLWCSKKHDERQGIIVVKT